MSTSDALPQLNNTTLDKGLKETQQALVKIANRLVTMAESQKELSSITAETARSMVAQKNRVADLEAKVHRLETNTVYSQGFYQAFSSTPALATTISREDMIAEPAEDNFVFRSDLEAVATELKAMSTEVKAMFDGMSEQLNGLSELFNALNEKLDTLAIMQDERSEEVKAVTEQAQALKKKLDTLAISQNKVRGMLSMGMF